MVGSPRRLEPANRRVRARSAGAWLLDTIGAFILYERGRHPELAFPRHELPIDGANDASDDEVDGRWVTLGHPWNGETRIWAEAPRDLPKLADLAVVTLEAAEEWFEEDQPLVSKVRDPYRRVDVIDSSREIAVEVEGIEIVRTANTRLLLETGMPPAWYVPLADIAADRFTPSPLRTRCQYKGEASYWDIRCDRIFENLAWGYHDPVLATAQLAGFVCVTPWSDAVRTTVDGQVVVYEPPSPDWSNPLSASS